MPQQATPDRKDHVSVQEFAAHIKQQYPRFQTVPDDQLAHAFIEKYPQLSTLIDFPIPEGTVKPPPTFGSPAWIKEKLWNAADTTTQDLPQIGGMLGSILTSEGGPIAMTGGAGIGGMVGAGARGNVRSLLFDEKKSPEDLESEMGEEGLGQAALEAISGLATKPIRTVAKKMLLPDNVDVMKTNKDFGLKLTYPEQVPGPIAEEFQRTAETSPLTRHVAQKGRERTLDAAEKGLRSESEKALGKQPVSNITGTQVQKNATKISREGGVRGNIQVFKDRVNNLKSQLNAHLQNQVADPSAIADLKAEAEEELEKIETLRTRPAQQKSDTEFFDEAMDELGGGKSFAQLDKATQSKVMGKAQELKESGVVRLDTAAATGTRMKLLKDITKLKDSPLLSDLIDLRSKWMGITPEITEPLSNESPAAAKHYVERMTGVIDQSIIGTRSQQAWNAFRNFTRKGSQVFESQRVVQLLNSDPEKIVSTVGPRDITGALQVRRAIMSYASQFGSPSERKLAMESWNKFRAMWFDENVIRGPLDKLPERMKGVDPAVLQHVIATDPQGRVLVQNTLRLSRALDRLAAMAPRNMHALLSFTRGAIGAAAYAPSKWLYDPAMTARIMKGVEWLSTHPNISPANATRVLQMISEEPSAERNTQNEVPQRP